MGLRILLLSHSFNGLAQRLWVELAALGHQLSLELDIADAVTEEAVALFQPDLLVAPFLKRRIPESVWRRVPCLVVHPGPPGDRGPCALDWAILQQQGAWGVTVLQATEDFDAGPVRAWRPVALREEASKSSLYRREITRAAVAAVLEAVQGFAAAPGAPGHAPQPLRSSPPDLALPAAHGWRGLVPPAERTLDWAALDSATLLRRAHSGDGAPGARAQLWGRACRVFDVHAASAATCDAFAAAAPGTVLARRGPALLLRTADGALWLGHVRLEDGPALKLPATQAFATEAAALPELAVPLQRAADEWDELRYEETGPDGARVGWLGFDFHNGAVSTRQCRRLLDALREVRRRPTQVLVLQGGEEFFCNGIHLHTIEAAAHAEDDSAADESMRNIEALDDVVLELLNLTDRITVAALRGNAGAGGCFLAFAADHAWAHGGVVLNPHYKNMGNLYGSEYWTYTLPRRLGTASLAEAAARVMQQRLPLSAAQAAEQGLLDAVLGADAAEFAALCMERAQALAHNPALLIAAKQARRAQDEARKPLARYRSEELLQMKRNFYGFDPSYHVARHHFVYRKPHAWTPRHLALHRDGTAKP